jgi:aminoglycoside/choline kinase family phosphotransferase
MSYNSGARAVLRDQEPLDRESLRAKFLRDAGWGDAQVAPLAGDASTRSYYRVTGSQGRAVLMDAPPAAESAPCPPDADEDARRLLGYNAIARLAGPDSRAFAALAEWLCDAGFSAPHVLSADYNSGYLLLEDLRDDLFAKVIAQGESPRPLYEAAIDVLVNLHSHDAPKIAEGCGASHPILTYDILALTAEVDLLLDWYVPAATGSPASDTARNELQRLWHEAWACLPPSPSIARVGLIDFQDALAGHPAYDLVSLLTDARRDVESDIARDMLERYIIARGGEADFNEGAFRTAYALLSIQRNAKILGIFARLWKRDGKPKYLGYLPRVWQYVESDLSYPALTALKDWFAVHIPTEERGDWLQKRYNEENK